MGVVKVRAATAKEVEVKAMEAEVRAMAEEGKDWVEGERVTVTSGVDLFFTKTLFARFSNCRPRSPFLLEF